VSLSSVTAHNKPTVTVTESRLTGDKITLIWSAGSVRGQLVEALRYKPAGRGFDSRRCHLNFSLTMALELTQPITEMSTRNISCGVKAAGAYG